MGAAREESKVGDRWLDAICFKNFCENALRAKVLKLCIIAFAFVSIHVSFEFIMKVISDDDNEFDDDERTNWKKVKFVSNDTSGHDDQFCPRIVKIRALLLYFWRFKNLLRSRSNPWNYYVGVTHCRGGTIERI